MLILVTTLGLLLWVRTTRTEQSTVAVNQEFGTLRQEFGQKKWQGYDISQAAKILKQSEEYNAAGDYTQTSESLQEAEAAISAAPLLYRDHAKSISRNPDNGHLLFLPWTTYTPFEREIEWAAQRYDVFVLSSSREDFVPRIKSHNPDAEVYLYIDLPIKEEYDTTNGSLPGLTDAFQTHPEWFLTTTSGRPVSTQEVFTYYWPDPSNETFRTTFITEMISLVEDSQINWDGVVLDNFRTLRDLSGDGTPDIADYPSDETFRDAQISFLTEMRDTLREASLSTIVELPPYAVENEEWKALNDLADGLMISGFGREEFNTDDGHLSAEKFRQQIQVLEETDRTQKRMFVVTHVPFWSDKGISVFGYAGALLGRALETDHVYYYGLEDSTSIPAYWYREYEIDLGAARDVIASSDELLIRLFEKGAVVVNPTGEERAIQFDATYKTIQGVEATTFVLSAHQALILQKP